MKFGKFMAIDFGTKRTGIAFHDPRLINQPQPRTYALIKMEEQCKTLCTDDHCKTGCRHPFALQKVDGHELLRCPKVIAEEMNTLAQNNQASSMLIGLPDGFPPQNGTAHKIVSMVKDLTDTGILRIPFAYEDERGSTIGGRALLKKESKEMRRRAGIVDCFSARFNAERYVKRMRRIFPRRFFR